MITLEDGKVIYDDGKNYIVWTEAEANDICFQIKDQLLKISIDNIRSDPRNVGAKL